MELVDTRITRLSWASTASLFVAFYPSKVFDRRFRTLSLVFIPDAAWLEAYKLESHTLLRFVINLKIRVIGVQFH